MRAVYETTVTSLGTCSAAVAFGPLATAVAFVRAEGGKRTTGGLARRAEFGRLYRLENALRVGAMCAFRAQGDAW